ncbi:MAG TPA: DUF4129 domain-containing protein [Myxococcaceae bacterium]|nr:DUF4129 domain-containing protein [Myxococcaceae bacterium]
MIAAEAMLAAMVAMGSPPCDDVPGERAALEQAVKGEVHFSYIASALEERCGAPLAAGLKLDGPPAEAAEALGTRLEAFCARSRAEGRAALRVGDREHLDEILSRPEFSQARAADVDGLTRLSLWLTSWLEALFETRGALGFVRWTRVLVLVAAIAVALGVGFRVAGALRRRRGRRQEEVAREGRLELDAPSVHLERGGTMVEGDPRGAIREGLFALLGALERRSLARPDRVRTNREVAEEVAQRGAAPELSEQVRGLLGWYDRTYYSLERPAAPEAKRFLEDVGQLATRLAERPA